MVFYTISKQKIIDTFATNMQTGLTNEQVHKRRIKFGLNRLTAQPTPTLLKLFLKQYTSPFIFILLIAALVKFIIGDSIDGLVITIILLINAAINTVQEKKAQNIILELEHLIKTKCIVLRNGDKIIIDDEQLVPGDIIILEPGSKIPADCRLLVSHTLLVDESSVTGESIGTEKDADFTSSKKIPLYLQKNMIFAGTYILKGEGIAVVVATGDDSYIGKIHTAALSADISSTLHQDLRTLSKFLVIFCCLGALFLLSVLIYYHFSIHELLSIVTSVLVAIIPEGLPLVTTIVLVTGAYQMAKQKVLVKKLSAIETLGRINTLIIDKTGTLTRNELMAVKIYTNDKFYEISGHGYNPDGVIALHGQTITDYPACLWDMGVIGQLTNQAAIKYNQKTHRYEIQGEPIQAALAIFSKKMGIDRTTIAAYHELLHIPFDTETRLSAYFFKKNNAVFLYVIGSPEHIFNHCVNICQSTHDALGELLKDGLRIVAVASKEISTENEIHDVDYKQHLNNLCFLGFYGLQDTLRVGLKDIITQVRNAGFHIAIATGDHKKTACSVATATGIYTKGDYILTGEEFSALPPKQVTSMLAQTTVFARMSPTDKLNLVKAFQQTGFKVAMTGDGVNDVPSILAADVGIAMGIMGSDITRQAADIVLLNDSFVSIVDGIQEGRHIFLTLRRVILYLIATNLSEILVIIGALIITKELPLLAKQILWINIVTDSFLDSALAFEPRQKDLLQGPLKITHLIDRNFTIKALYMALIMAGGTLFVYYLYNKQPQASTMVLVTLSMFQWLNAWNLRSESRSLFTINLATNRLLIAAQILVIIMQFFAVNTKIGNTLLELTPLTLWQWLLAACIASTIIISEEIRKKASHLYPLNSLQ